MDLIQKISEAKAYILSRAEQTPTIGIILGSGLGPLAEQIEHAVTIPYSEIPHFAKSSAIGHANELVIGSLGGKTVAAMKGRFHYYEGFTLEEVTFPVRVMKAIGVQTIILTNACGAVNTSFNPGDLMLITDHINLCAANPLIGPNYDELGPRFPDSSQIYNKELRALALDVAEELGVSMQQGVYCWWTGPAYETPAEIRMMRAIGGDAAGMSTVPEALVATHGGMKVLGISCLTNMASGILDQPLSHQEVIDVAEKVKANFMKLVKTIVTKI